MLLDFAIRIGLTLITEMEKRHVDELMHAWVEEKAHCTDFPKFCWVFLFDQLVSCGWSLIV